MPRKKYYELHKKELQQKQRERYANNKEEYNKKIICEKCNRVVIARMYKQHTTTYIHHRNGILLTPITKNPREKKPKPPTLMEERMSAKKNGWVIFE